MSNFAIIAIGYNKTDSLIRLLDSLEKAEYGTDSVPLIVSIDKSENDAVIQVADRFEWTHGIKKIRTFQERQGLKPHILSCGDYLEQYEAVFVLEDDIVVSPYFYQYGKSCINYYKSNEQIEGISLYSPAWNQNANLPFTPLKTKYDTFFMQYAQSWGQIWLRDRWKKFKAWYENNIDFFEKKIVTSSIPENLYTWGENSWLKFHIAYCIVEKKYFVYPYASYTTAFTESGTHVKIGITRFHAELMIYDAKPYRWAPFNENALLYDAFFENNQIKRYLPCEKQEVSIDLYGRRKSYDQYILSTQILPFKVEREYALQLRPIELNVIMDVEGTGIYLYHTATQCKISQKQCRQQLVKKWNYFMKERFLMWEEILPVCLQKISNLIYILRYRKNG